MQIYLPFNKSRHQKIQYKRAIRPGGQVATMIHLLLSLHKYF